MNALTAEWVHKAEGDLITALREYRARQRPNYNATCFHAQQVAEKCLKAYLNEHGAETPRIHSLIELVRLCTDFDNSLFVLMNDCKSLDGYAVRTRYPGQDADREEAKIAIHSAQIIRKAILDRIGSYRDLSEYYG
jgi:HEPN domain-containing protein